MSYQSIFFFHICTREIILEPQKERTGVCIGAGIGHVDEIYDAGSLVYANKIKKISPYFVPRILVNMASGHISIAHGLRGSFFLH